MEPVASPSRQKAIAELRRQRCDYAKQVEAGQPLLQASIDFIDNMLAMLVPGYEPPKGKCCCEDR